MAKILKSPFRKKSHGSWFAKYCRGILNTSASDQKNRTFLKVFQQLLIDKKSAKNAQRGLTETEIISQIFVIFVAGYETTKTLLQTAFYHLAKDQKLQQAVLEEVRGLDEHYDNLNPKKMPLTCAVLHECLRLFPPVGIHLRWCEADALVNGIPMTRGTKKHINNS